MFRADQPYWPQKDISSFPTARQSNNHGISLHSLANALFNPRFTWEGLPQTPVPSKTKQTTLPSRTQLISWFQSLSSEQLLSATLIEDPTFVEDFLKNYPSHKGKLLHLPSSRSYKPPFPTQLATPLDLLTLVRVALAPEPQLYLSAEETTAKQILLALNAISGGKIFELPIRTFYREKPDQNLLWFSNATFHQLEEWLASALEKAILSYYFAPKDRFGKTRALKNFMIEKKASKGSLGALQMTLNQVEQGFFNQRGKLSQIVRGFDEAMRDQLHEQMLNIVVDIKKKKRRRARKEKPEGTVKPGDIGNNPEEQTDIGKLDGAAEQNQQNLEKEVLTPEELLTGTTASASSFKESSCVNSQASLKQGFTSQTIQLDLTQCSQTQLISESANIEASLTVECQITSFNQQQSQDQKGQTEDIKLDEDCFEEKIKIKRNSSHHHIGSTKLMKQGEDAEEEDSSTTAIKKKRRKKGQKSQNKVVEEFRSKITSIIMNKQLNNMLDSLSLQSNSSYESKVISFERVRYFTKSLYPQAQAVLFGSNAVGLSLPSSDIDIMLVDLPVKSKDDICQCLAQLAIYVNTMGWVTSCSTYFNAKVPLVKLEIDPSVGYYTPKCRNDYFGSIHHPCSLDLKDPSKGVPVKVDITISTEEGRTSSSTELMRTWMETNSSLQRILLALKYSLSLRGFSQNFKGGIGSYCLFVMVAAYFREFEEAREGEDCEILLDVLKFYGQDFQNQLKVVTLGEDQRCFVSNEEAKESFELTDQILFNNLLKIIDPLNGKLMSSSCFQFNCIKAEWRRIRGEILKLQDMVQSEIDGCFGSAAEMGKIMTSRKSLERWANKAQGRIDFSMADILQQQY